MIIRCTRCGRFMGFKELRIPVLLGLPFRKLEVTHGICRKCLEKQGADPGPPE